MINNRKLIGVCLTRIHDSSRMKFIELLQKNAVSMGMKLIIFNSFTDYYKVTTSREGARYIYENINFKLLDALVILDDNFYDKGIMDRMISHAKQDNVPVIIVNGSAEGCYCVCGDFKEAYKKVIRHIICDHGAADTLFIGGKKDNDESTVLRLQCYKEVLGEQGLPFDESMVEYGEYWDVPVKVIIENKIKNNEKLPRAIICANDVMGFAACDVLKKHGYRVPEDVIVTGFDGLTSGEFRNPQLTTCCEDYKAMAAECAGLIQKLTDGKESESKVTYSYSALLSESCGCGRYSSLDYRLTAASLQHTLEEMSGHEDFMYAWIDRILEINDTSSFYSILSDCVLQGSYVCLRRDFFSTISINKDHVDNSRLSGDLMVISSSRNNKNSLGVQNRFNAADMVPDLNEWMKNDDTMYILSSIFVAKEFCGYYAVKADKIFDIAHKINRVSKTVNIAFSTAVNRFRQKLMKHSIDNAAFVHPITELYNLKGLTKWFDEFSSKQSNRTKTLAVSLYSLRKYQYIYENYGINDIEEALCFIAETLKISNPTDCVIAHISEDEFVIINYIVDPNEMTQVINHATSVFFGMIEDYNTNNGKDYYVEVNCGCTVVNSGWKDSLESFIKLAGAEMYINRVKSGVSPVIKEEKQTAKHDHSIFSLLIDRNLFSYHFQPIISAATGDIYAYEALMRTDASINMSPLEILEAAEKYQRLYDIERATLFNVMDRFANEYESFGGKKVFINSIPGHFLKDSDVKVLTDKYSKYMNNFVFEITEQNSISDEELNSMRQFAEFGSETRIAIDDYGTGHSNIVNLLRYSPQIIKIDRFLISGIDTDVNKQMFVRSTIEFARLNNIEVLAEGVETSEELRTVLSFGVDYIQGYYTGRPAPMPILEIPQSIKDEFILAGAKKDTIVI